MRKVSPSEWTGPWPPFTGAQITFGPKRTRPSEEELAKRRDVKMSQLEVAAILEKDTDKKAELQRRRRTSTGQNAGWNWVLRNRKNK